MAVPTRKPVLVMGARGSVGALVLAELLDRGVPVRASARRPEPGTFPEGIDVRAADLTDASSLDGAFAGVGQVFLYANPVGVEGVIAAARNAGVERIVLMSSGSVVHPSSRGNAITEEHREVEEAFAAATDLTIVPVRPLVLATNALGWAHPIRALGAVPLYRPDALTAPIHERDIAAVVVRAIDGAEGVSELLTGPARITQREQVAAIAAATGRDIGVRELTRTEGFAQLSRLMPDGEAEAVLRFLDDAAEGSSPATDAVDRILGRPAIGFDVWAADHAREFSAGR